MQHKELTVGLGNRAYDIVIGPDLIDRAGEILGRIAANRHIVVISDENVAKLHLKRLKIGLRTHARAVGHFEVPAGEASKSMKTLSILLENILAVNVDRSVLLIAFGGGVVGDLTGFAAASLLRGVDYVQIPTTLLAQVDSSVGGKTGVNATAGKNLIGAFYQPKAVLADTSLLATLPMRELKAGYAEVAKYGLLGDATFFCWLEHNSADILRLETNAITNAIYTSCHAKARIVEMDEHENGNRALLNLGHTFAHAFEAEAGYNGSLLHGEAVAAGIALAFDLSVDLNLCEPSDAARCKAHFRANGLPTGQGDLKSNLAGVSKLLNHMKHDKKVQNGRMHFILVRAIGDAFISGNVPPKMVKALLQRGHDAI